MNVLLGDPWRSILLYLGPTVAVLVIALYGFYVGWWRTKFELEVWVDRAEHAEHVSETILPAVQDLTRALDKLTTIVEERLHYERHPSP